MNRTHTFGIAVALAAMLIATPASTNAASSGATCPTVKARTLPAGKSGTVFVLGVKGGSLRPWKVTIGLDGTITASGTSAASALADPKNELPALMTLANAQGFFSLKKTVGCISGAGNPDTSMRYITIHTSSGTKRVNGIGDCDAHFTGLYDVLSAAAGVGM
jgi:hypothetical protein